jgi:hypothetical protein
VNIVIDEPLAWSMALLTLTAESVSLPVPPIIVMLEPPVAVSMELPAPVNIVIDEPFSSDTLVPVRPW